MKVYKIKGEEFKICSNDQLKYENEIDVFKINIKKVNLVKYIKETVINEDVINSYYQKILKYLQSLKNFPMIKLLLNRKIYHQLNLKIIIMIKICSILLIKLKKRKFLLTNL